MIKVITTKEQFIETKNIWDELYDLTPNATPFQKFDFVNTIIDLFKPFDEQLFFIYIKEVQKKEWIAIFPFVIDTRKNIHFIFDRHTDFCQPLVRGQADNFNLYDELSKWIIDNQAISSLTFNNLPSWSPLNSVLKTHFRYQITHDINYYPLVPILPKDSDRDCIDSLRSVQSTKRKNLRKQLTKAQSEGEFIFISKNNGDVYPESLIDELVRHMIKEGLRTREYLSSQMLSFWKTLFNAGILSIAFVVNGSLPLGCQLVYFDERKKEYITWILLYMDNSWNIKSCLMLVDYIYNHGGGTINFARGIYDYKLVNFHPDVKALFSVKIAKTRWGHLRNMASVGFHYLKPVIKSFLGR